MADSNAVTPAGASGFSRAPRGSFFDNKLVLLPLAACFSFPATFFVTYGIAVGNRHVAPGFPFISDTGTTSPESCVFGQLLNMVSVLVALTIYVKYRQLLTVTTDGGGGGQCATTHFRRANAAALWLGLAAAFGVSLVANFQWTNVFSVHMVGAFLTFILGNAYGWLQCWLSRRAPPPLCGKPLFLARVLTMSVATLFLLLMVVGYESSSAEIRFTDYAFAPSSWALLASTSEWVMSFGLAAMFATFAMDFRHVHVASPAVTAVSHSAELWLHKSAEEQASE